MFSSGSHGSHMGLGLAGSIFAGNPPFLVGSGFTLRPVSVEHGEVLAGNYDQLSDLWSCGVIMYVRKPKVAEEQIHWMNEI